MTQEQALAEIALDLLEIGRELGSIEHVFTPEEVVKYTGFLEDGSPWFHTKAESGPVRVHPMMLANDYSDLILKHFRAPHLVLVETKHTYLRPVWTGRRLRSFGKVTDKGLRNEREYVEIETWTMDEDGVEVARMRTRALLSVETKAQS